MNLRYGYNAGIPDGVDAAWGARLIIDQSGQVDMVWDRTDCAGPDDRRRLLLDRLNGGAGRAATDRLADLLRADELSTREDREVVLYEDDHLVYLANPRASAGYAYVCAYLKQGA